MHKKRVLQSQIRHKRLRKKITGSAQKPRLCVYRSLKNISAQIIDDAAQKTLLSVSTYDKEIKKAKTSGGNTAGAELLGRLLAEKSIKKGIKQVVFDRGGRKYHGRVKAFAESARKQGLVF
jgi:large subunit ribosomal protein L18